MTIENGKVGIGTTLPTSKLHVAETWNNAGTTFTAAKVDITNANSAPDSKLLDLQVGVTSQFNVRKDGLIQANAAGAAFPGGVYAGGSLGGGIGTSAVSLANAPGAVTVASTGEFSFSTTTNASSGARGTILVRDGADNNLALRNGANGQTFSVYGTYPGAAWERFTITAPTSGNVLLGTYRGTGGIARGLEIQTDGVSRWTISTAGHFLAAADNTYDIGPSGANRPRDIYAGGNGIFGGLISATNGFRAPGSSQFIASSDGVWRLTNATVNDFNRLQFGGTTDAFPAIARDGAGIKITGAAAGLTSHIKVPAVAVTSLPAAATAGVGARAFVNDALSPVFGSTVATGGAVAVPVYSDGAAWKVG
jgi:hypothetical protein